MGEPIHCVCEWDGKKITDLCCYHHNLAEVARAEGRREGLEAAEQIALNGPVEQCPFERSNCKVTPEQLCPVCGDPSWPLPTASKCVTSPRMAIAQGIRALIDQEKSDAE